MEKSQLPAAPPVLESGSPRTTPWDSTAPTKDVNAPFAEDCATCITLQSVQEGR